jgi:hypothetical protein
MTEDTENLVLEILKKMQGDVAATKEDMHLMRMEMTAIRHDLASVRTLQDVQSVELERLKGRLDRVESRLELRDQ